MVTSIGTVSSAVCCLRSNRDVVTCWCLRRWRGCAHAKRMMTVWCMMYVCVCVLRRRLRYDCRCCCCFCRCLCVAEQATEMLSTENRRTRGFTIDYRIFIEWKLIFAESTSPTLGGFFFFFANTWRCDDELGKRNVVAMQYGLVLENCVLRDRRF